MSIIDSSNFFTARNSRSGYDINQSLRFRGAQKLQRSVGTTGDRRNWTLSVWYKGIKGTGVFLESFSSLSNWSVVAIAPTGSLLAQNRVSGTTVGPNSANDSKYFRDPSAWYHLVVNQNGSTNDCTIYINGSSVLSVSITTNWLFNTSGQAMAVGARTINDEYFENYMAEYHFIDGQVLTPSSFGETDTITGAWIPKEYSGSYGTNGFYLKFDPSATNGIGHDHSGNGNNFTATGFSTSGTGTDVMSDTPTTNYPTLNPIYVTPPYPTQTQNATLSDGNLAMTFTGVNGGTGPTFSELPTTGKWYFEAKQTSADNTNIALGFFGRYTAGFDTGWRIVHSNGGGGFFYSFQGPNSGAEPSGTTAYSSGNVLGIEIDMDNSTLQFHVNGTYATKATGLTFAGYTPLWIDFRRQNSTGTNNSWLFNFGQRAFEYTPTSGFKALNTANLPEPTIKKGSKYFNTVLYTGNGTDNHAITGVGFQPSFTWFKTRSVIDNHVLNDEVRGANRQLFTNLTEYEFTATTLLKSFDNDGFTLGTDSGANGSGRTFVAWNWLASNTSGSSNTAGTITSTVSANATAGFSIVTYTGTGANATVGHGLGVAPKMVIVKSRDTNPSDWLVYHSAANTGNPGYMYLNLNLQNQIDSGNGVWNDTRPTSTVFSVGNYVYTNKLNDKFIAYCFSEVAGYSKFGSYTGNGNSDGPFVFTGFRPAFVMVKVADSAGEWYIEDNVRDTYNPATNALKANLADTDTNNSIYSVDYLSNGFKMRTSNTSYNWSGKKFIYMAFAELPFNYSNAR